MSKRRKKGVRKGMEGQGRFAPPERNGLGTYGTHRTADMEDARARRIAAHRDISNTYCHKFNDSGMRLEEPCDRGTPGCSVKHATGYERCETW